MGNALFEGERARPGPDQPREMGSRSKDLPEIVGERADIGPFAAVDDEFQFRVFVAGELDGEPHFDGLPFDFDSAPS